MLFWFIILYWLVSVAIGLYAATRVHNTRDFSVAGRHLPFHIVTATVFATWFGSETVLGIPATFMKEGIGGIFADPFGSSMCLILVGLLYAVPLYRKKLLTIGDYYRLRFGRDVEMLTTLAIVLSYLGWVAAQVTALGLVFNVISDGSISREHGMWIGAMTILVYTIFGGMWAVAITDFIQMIVIVVGLLWISNEVASQVGGVGTVVAHAQQAGLLSLPNLDVAAVISMAAAWLTMMLGSIPQQDVFQRVQSSRNERIAKWASVTGGSLYFLFAFIPIFLTYSATLIAPDIVAKNMEGDTQLILPSLVLAKAPLFAQIMFFGALLSAIKSCASATILAPSITFTQNILLPLMGHRAHHLSDRKRLRLMQAVTCVFTILVLIYASSTKNTIYKMVENAYHVTLVVAFVPLTAGLFWRRATRQGALAAVIAGFVVWVAILYSVDEEKLLIPARFWGLFAAIFAMIAGSLLPQRIRDRLPHHEREHQQMMAAHDSDAQGNPQRN